MAVPPIQTNLLQGMSGIPASGIDLDLVVIVGGIVLTTVAYQVALAIRHTIEARTTRGRADQEIKAQIERLQLSVDSVAVEVERIAEAQRFSARLLAERASRAQRDDSKPD